MNIININGKQVQVAGNNIVVKNNKVMVDGVVVGDQLQGNVQITFEGDLASLDCTTATINGNVRGNVDCTTLNCNDIHGDVDCTTVRCRDIGGDVDATTVKKSRH